MVDGVDIAPNSVICLLGVLVDEVLSFDNHMYVIQSLNQELPLPSMKNKGHSMLHSDIHRHSAHVSRSGLNQLLQ